MHDALAHVGDRVVVDAEIARVLVQGFNLNAAVFGHCGGIGTVQRGWHVVVGHGYGFFGRAHGAVGHAQTFKGLRAGHFMHEVTVDIQKAGAIGVFLHQMGIPDFIIERFGGGHSGFLFRKLKLKAMRQGRSARSAKHQSFGVEPPRQAVTVGNVKNTFHG